MDFPEHIRFKSDKNEMKLVPGTESFKAQTDRTATYEYTKSETKKGMLVSMKLDYIQRLIKDTMVEIVIKKKRNVKTT